MIRHHLSLEEFGAEYRIQNLARSLREPLSMPTASSIADNAASVEDESGGVAEIRANELQLAVNTLLSAAQKIDELEQSLQVHYRRASLSFLSRLLSAISPQICTLTRHAAIENLISRVESLNSQSVIELKMRPELLASFQSSAPNLFDAPRINIVEAADAPEGSLEASWRAGGYFVCPEKVIDLLSSYLTSEIAAFEKGEV